MTVDQDIYRRMSDADKAGFQARSPEGHAAKGMRIQGQEEVWIRIQADTFKNWVNVTLREEAVNASLNAPLHGGSSGNIMRGDEQAVRYLCNSFDKSKIPHLVVSMKKEF